MPRYLAQFGQRLLDAGYEIVPLRPGLKHPGMPDWQRVPSNAESLGKWLANGRADDGVGVRTAKTPAIDLDIYDVGVAEEMEKWCQTNVGMAPVRIGLPPKRLLVYRTDVPFAKMASTWVDALGKEHKVEILGDGQQFCGFHRHPDTKQPYTWTGADSLLTLSHDDLEPLTPDLARAALAEFDRLAGLKGWTRKPTLNPLTTHSQPTRDDDDALAYAQDAPDISDEALRTYLMAIEDADDYDRWVHVGMALHHHYDGTDDGLELWREWSERSPKYDAEALDRKWPSLKAGPDRRALTARYIIMLGKRAGAAPVTAPAVRENHKDRLDKAQTLDELRVITDAVAASRDIDQLTREALEGALREAFKRITRASLSAKTARGMLRPPVSKSGEDGTPNWLKGWVFLAGEDKLYHVDTGEKVSRIGFDARYNRYMLTEADEADGKGVPTLKAADYATTVAKIPAPYLCVYMPGEDREFVLGGQPMINSYRGGNIPAVPETLTPRDRRNVEIVKGHFELLVPDARERAIALSFIAHPVKTLGRVNFALVIQGTEGDGKSFLMPLLGALCGSDNVKTVAPSTMSHGTFTAFAGGALIGIVEEIKLHGHNRFDVLNAIKPLITNPVIEIHGKGKDPINVPNTQSYILLTNFADALPITDEDSRYFIINSRFQSQAELREWNAAHPSYFDDLFNAIDESPGAVLGWLRNIPVHPEFRPKARAPWSRGRAYMAKMAASDEATAVEIALKESGHPAVASDLLDQGVLAEEIERLTETVLKMWQVRRKLSELGYREIGRYDIKGSKRTLWSRTPLVWEIENAPGQYDRTRLFERLTRGVG
jgi:hypothetical protein